MTSELMYTKSVDIPENSFEFEEKSNEGEKAASSDHEENCQKNETTGRKEKVSGQFSRFSRWVQNDAGDELKAKSIVLKAKASCQFAKFKRWVKNDPEDEDIPGGIPNIGATCYANSVFQVLGQTPGLVEVLKTCKPKDGLEKPVAVDLLLSLLDDLKSKRVVDHNKVQSLLACVIQHDDSFLLGHQNDCHSFLLSLLNILKYSLAEGSFAIFEGKQCNEFQYTSCDHVEMSDEQMFSSLLIPVQENNGWAVEDGLTVLFMKECFDDNVLSCRICEEQNKTEDHLVTKKTVIMQLPKILILHIARFKEVPVEEKSLFKKLKKVDWCLQYKEYLDITEFCAIHLQEQPALYRLYAVISHKGSLFGGHYYANIRALNSESWFSCSDSSVGSISYDQFRDENAYILFYEREDLEHW